MSKTVQLKRGTTAQVAAYTGPAGEIVVDTDRDTAVVQDGTAGGNELLARKTPNVIDVSSTAPALLVTQRGSGEGLRVDGGSITNYGGGGVISNTAYGVNALFSNTTGVSNTASGVNTLTNNTTGNDNTASGYFALLSNTTGGANTAIGVSALLNNTTGDLNTASGVNALRDNTTGNDNTASGVNALLSNTTGNQNTASGRDSLLNNTTGINNTASGRDALQSNTTGSGNTASGAAALLLNTIGVNNTASGFQALFSNTTGNENTASGVNALLNNTTGGNNTASGVSALLSNTTGANNTASGRSALVNNTTGINNFAIGLSSGADALRNITTQSNEGVLGNNSTVAIYAKVAITVTSDIRDKTEIDAVPLGLDFVNKVSPISYRFKESRDSDVAKGRKHLGFSAQELLALQGSAEIIDDSDSDNLKINKDDLIAVLFNAVKELSARIETLENK